MTRCRRGGILIGWRGSFACRHMFCIWSRRDPCRCTGFACGGAGWTGSFFTVDLVRGALSASDPRLSPVHAVFNRAPPVVLQVGTSEILLDDSRRMADVLRQAGGDVTLSEWPDCPHVWQMLDGYVPEAQAALVEVAGFVARLVKSSLRPPDGS